LTFYLSTITQTLYRIQICTFYLFRITKDSQRQGPLFILTMTPK